MSGFRRILASWFGGGKGAPATEQKSGLPDDWKDLLGGSSTRADLSRPYANSVWVSRAIKHCSGPIEAVPLVITRDRRGGDQLVDDPKLTTWLERPAKTRGGQMTWEDFIQATIGWLKLRGEAFWVMDDTWLVRGATRSPLILARPDQMREILDDDRALKGWLYTDAAGIRNVLIPEQVAQIKSWNPYDDIRGLAEWEAAKIAAQADYAQGMFARNLAENNGDRGPYVIGKDGTASPEQIAQITSMLRQKRERGRNGDFRAVFLSGNVDVKEPSLQSVDAAYVAQRLENRHEIYVAFGVPPSFADVTASYSIGSASDRYRMIEDTCMPLATKLAGALEQVIGLWYDDQQTYFAEFDFDEHSTLQQVRSERIEAAGKVVDRGMPWKDASDYFRLKLPRFRGDEIGRVPFNLQEIGADELPEDPPAKEKVRSAAEELNDLFQRRNVVATRVPAQGKAATNATWARIHRARAPWEKRFKSRIRRHLMEARRQTLAKIDAAAAAEGKAVAKTADPLSLIFDLAPWLKGWTGGLSEIVRNAIETAGGEIWTDELHRDDPLTMPAAEVQVAIANRENRIRNAGTQIWEQIRDELQAGIDAGDTMQDLANRMRRAFNGIDQSRANTIAVTETTVAYETGRDIAMRTAGVQWSQWLSAGDGRERHTHLMANEQIREVGVPFDVGGYQMQFPGDPAGPGQEVINCRCVRIAVAGPDGGDIEGNENDEIPY